MNFDNDGLERFVSRETAERIRKKSKDQAKKIGSYIKSCSTISGYIRYKIGWENEDFENKKITVIIYYENGFTRKKF